MDLNEMSGYFSVCQSQYLSFEDKNFILKITKGKPPIAIFNNIDPFTLQKKNLLTSLSRFLNLLKADALNRKLGGISKQIEEIYLLNAIKIYEIPG